jgi:hypothetical protein
MSATILEAIQSLRPKALWGSKNIAEYNAIEWFSTDVTKPTEEEVNTEIARLNAYAPFADCKKQAKVLLANTDWSALPDAAASLTNQAEFIAYRAAVRALVINPVASPSFPTVPTAQWSS